MRTQIGLSLSAAPDPDDYVDGAPRTALTLAANNGAIDACRALLALSKDPKRLLEFQDARQDTALIASAGTSEEPEMAEYLLEQGADPHHRVPSPKLACHLHREPPRPRASDQGAPRRAPTLTCATAARAASRSIFAPQRGRLSRRARECSPTPGIDIDRVDKAGLSALHLAAKNGHEDAVRTLLAAKAGASLAPRDSACRRSDHGD